MLKMMKTKKMRQERINPNKYFLIFCHHIILFLFCYFFWKKLLKIWSQNNFMYYFFLFLSKNSVNIFLSNTNFVFALRNRFPHFGFRRNDSFSCTSPSSEWPEWLFSLQKMCEMRPFHCSFSGSKTHNKFVFGGHSLGRINSGLVLRTVWKSLIIRVQ